MGINTGGAAFPNSDDQAAHAIGTAAIAGITDPTERDRIYLETRGAAMQGMTLRDYFAAQAMQGLMTAQDQRGMWQYGDEPDVAAVAYKVADAMLAARGAA